MDGQQRAWREVGERYDAHVVAGNVTLWNRYVNYVVNQNGLD